MHGMFLAAHCEVGRSVGGSSSTKVVVVVGLASSACKEHEPNRPNVSIAAATAQEQQHSCIEVVVVVVQQQRCMNAPAKGAARVGTSIVNNTTLQQHHQHVQDCMQSNSLT